VTQPRSIAICATCLPLPRWSRSASSTCSVVRRPKRTSKFSVEGAGAGEAGTAATGAGAGDGTEAVTGVVGVAAAEVGGGLSGG
jgi:hypothetical protein